MITRAIFPQARRRAGLYESFYLRAFAPERPLGIWIRYTVHKRPGAPPRGSLWCTLFDGRRSRPFMHKRSTGELGVPTEGWIEIGGATLGCDHALGSCGEASWALRFTPLEPALEHLTPAWLYRTPMPRTKPTSPLPRARFEGSFTLAGEEPIDLAGWQGMVGHNWGSEHAERWIWLHASGFEQEPAPWLDVVLGRVRVAGRLTPWVASGVLGLDGRRHRLGGLRAGGLSVREAPHDCSLRLPGQDGLLAEARVQAPAGATAAWRYADPDGGEHDVLNCSIAQVTLIVNSTKTISARTLHTAHGAAYELGVRERDHGVPLAPFPDG